MIRRIVFLIAMATSSSAQDYCLSLLAGDRETDVAAVSISSDGAYAAGWNGPFAAVWELPRNRIRTLSDWFVFSSAMSIDPPFVGGLSGYREQTGFVGRIDTGDIWHIPDGVVYAVRADGVAVGWTGAQAPAMWKLQENVWKLHYLPTRDRGLARDISDAYIAGFEWVGQEIFPVLWDATTLEIIRLPAYSEGDVVGISRDGRFACGRVRLYKGQSWNAALWVKGADEDWLFVDLGRPDGADQANATAVNSSGEVVGFIVSWNGVFAASWFPAPQGLWIWRDLGVLTGNIVWSAEYTILRDIDERGNIVGVWWPSELRKQRPIFVYTTWCREVEYEQSERN